MLLALAAICALAAPGASAAKTEVRPAEERFEVFLQHEVHGHDWEGTHVLELTVYPLRGVAVARTQSNNFELENKETVAYAEEIPKGPFDGYLDVEFPGLGSFVGEFVATESGHEGHLPKGCAGSRETSASGSFEGSISFEGSGGYAHWSAKTARAFLQRSTPLRCRKGSPGRERKPKTLLGYTEIGPSFLGPPRYLLRARRRLPHRVTYFEVAGFDNRKPNIAVFDAGTYEYLPGGIAVSRAVDRTVRHGHRLEVSEGGYRPKRATLRPPPPFSGVAHYSRHGHKLTGNLTLKFPGLRLPISGHGTRAELVDEYEYAHRSPSDRRVDLAATSKPVQTVLLELTPRRDVQVYVEIHPLLGVAVLKTELGLTKEVIPLRRSGAVDYAARIPKAPFEGKLEVEIPGIALIDGELVPAEGGGLEFQGNFEFHGNGGYLEFDVHRTEAAISTESPYPYKSLFAYIPDGDLNISYENTQILTSELSSSGRASVFEARLELQSPKSSYAAETLEWLPGHVAARRELQALRVSPGSAFKVSSTAEHAKAARVRPPAPFFGNAVYRRLGSLRSPRGKLSGSLSVDLYGVKVRLAGAKAKASLFNFHPGF